MATGAVPGPGGCKTRPKGVPGRPRIASCTWLGAQPATCVLRVCALTRAIYVDNETARFMSAIKPHNLLVRVECIQCITAYAAPAGRRRPAAGSQPQRRRPPPRSPEAPVRHHDVLDSERLFARMKAHAVRVCALEMKNMPK